MSDKRQSEDVTIDPALMKVALEARASFVTEWLEEGRIDKAEGFRLEMDAYLGRDTGPVKWLPRAQGLEREKGEG